MTELEVVHILDRFVPELQQYLLIEDIGSYLIAEGLLSSDDYLMLTKHSSKKAAVVELLQLVKSKGPDCLQSFLHALHRSSTETFPPHQGHIHLCKLIQTSMSNVQHGAQLQPLKKQKSKSVLSLLSRTKRNKNSTSNKELSPPLMVFTPYSTAINSLKFNSSSTGTKAVSSLISSQHMMSSGSPVTLSGSSPSDEDNYRPLSYYSTSSEDCDSPPSLSLPSKTEQCATQELVKENNEKDLENKVNKLEEQKIKLQGHMQELKLQNEELKSQNEMYKTKMQVLEGDGEFLTLQLKAKNKQITKYNVHIDDLEKQVTSLKLTLEKVMQEKESLEKTVKQSLIPTRGPNSRPQRSHSLGHLHGASDTLLPSSTSLTSINEIEEFKYELDKIDAVLHSKLNYLTKVCQDNMREATKLNRKWQSENKLVQQHHLQENNPPFFVHSQT